jgi:hypothetical protein
MIAASSGGTAADPQPDYVWESAPAQFKVGELKAVNIIG